MAVSEEAVLKPLVKPKNTALINSDDWPTFSLRKGKVVSQHNGEPVSLLSAHKGHPVKVTGQLLEIEDDLQPLGMQICHLLLVALCLTAAAIVRDPNYKKQSIELTDVTMYAFAEYLDGTYGFWAAGKAGWFEFDSFAPSYQSIHDCMNEASSLIYMLADRTKKAKAKTPAGLDGSKLDKYMQAVFRDVCLIP